MKMQGNYFTLPNEVFQLRLSAGELAVYSYLRCCEDRRTHQCWPSYRTIGCAVGMSENTVRKYVLALEERGLIVTEPTDVRLKNGRRRNGNLKYTLPPIQEVLRDYYARQQSALEARTERQRVQKIGGAAGERPAVRPCEALCGAVREPVGSKPLPGILGGFGPVLRLCGGRKKKLDKGVTSSPPFLTGTTARSAGSTKGFRHSRK